MLTLALIIAFGLVGAATILAMFRLLRGPSMPDRILALDTLTINSIAILILLGMTKAKGIYFEVALLMALLGFISTLALCKFLLRGDIIE